ncbi:MAG: efflux RND transporter periplasmic adaptor subunit [Acidobacteria bacterium Pan2503]|uniref:Efflux RND transporter periplasmic adaptor subunit n=1 Tax=Candidatus Acidiferrum panamense TaxID=2741543 RepID=A0A7V8NM48_9BACT|nr:efflux RND transporter periplasmic adaptor subunit [Candidatus Acidoferrum panamensis]
MEPEYQESPRNRISRVFTVLFFLVIMLVILGGVTLFERRAQYQALANETESLAIPTVAVIHPAAEASQEDLVLPGTLQAYVESPIYARTNGYLQKWYHDIGSRVQKGNLLADIDTPEVDQQLSQARADLSTAKANAHLSEITATRYAELIKTDGVSKQEVDNAVGDLEAKKATVESSEANVRRLEELESFKHIYAPFSGYITKRNVDTGTLINAGNGGSSQQLFVLSQIDPIRVYLSVPETYAPSIHAGLGSFLELTQYPGQKFEGKVVRTAESIDTATRTLLTEVDVPNHNGALLPGGYAQVHLQVKVSATRLSVPVNALLFRSEGLRAAVVDANHKVHLRALTIGRDYGTSLEVLQGLEESDWIVLNPADSLDEGEEVRVAVSPGVAPGKPQKPAPGSHKP